MDMTKEIAETLGWMIDDMNYRRSETGLDSAPLSLEMKKAIELHSDLVACRIRCSKTDE
jgi:hypothetical protein